MGADTNKRVTAVTHWGAYELEIENRRVVKVHGFSEDVDPSPIGQSLSGTLDDDCRIRAPMVRKGFLEKGYQAGGEGRGSEPFIEVSWEEAEKLVADEIKRVRENYGNESIFGGSYGWASAGRFHHALSQIHRFLVCAGGYTDAVDTYSFAAAEVIVPHVIGDFWHYIYEQTSWPSIVKDTEVMLAFGGLPLKNAQIDAGGTACHVQKAYMKQAKERGVKFINIGPLRDDCAEFLDAQWYAPRPNTDVAIMLGIAHTLVINNLHDQKFLDKYCVGFERFLPYLMGEIDGQPKDAEWAAGISGLATFDIHELALQVASHRTMISLSWSLTRQHHGEQPYWMGITLAAMLGQIGLPGGGIGFGYCADNAMGNHSGKVKLGSLRRGENPVKTSIPVARISDMLLQPGESYDYNGKRSRYPDIRLVYWAGGNPFHHHQDTAKLLQAWHKPETIVVNEIWWNATARHADIVLPATSSLERNDIAGSSYNPTVFAMHAAVEPYGQARDDYDIFRGIASHLGCEEAFTENRSEMEWLRHLYEISATNIDTVEFPSFETFWNGEGIIDLPVPEEDRVILNDFRKNPEANPLGTPSGKIEIFSDTIAGFNYDDCPGHPAWMEPVEWLGAELTNRYPLHLISNQPKTRLHSQLDNGVTSRDSKIQGREPMRISPREAALRGIERGDVVRIYNDRGQCLAGAIIDENIREQTIQIATGAWWDPEIPGRGDSLCVHGQVNVLTMDNGTSKLAQGPNAMSCLVEVEKYEKELPPVTVFNRPISEPR